MTTRFSGKRPSRMIKPPSFLKIFTETGPLAVLAVVIALLVGIMAPASAQFFNFGGPPQRPSSRNSGGGGFGGGLFGGSGGDFWSPFQQQAPRQQRVYQDFSKAPPPEKRETVPERNVLVMGDGMADWLAYGLEDAYSDQPDMGVIRKAKNTSGLIRYQPKGDPADWAAAAKGILATEKPDVVVVMLGLNDRVARREPVVEKSDKDKDKDKDKAADKKNEKKEEKKDARAKPDGKTDEEAKTDDKDTDVPQDEAANPD